MVIDYIVNSWYNIIMGYIVFAISTISPLGAHVNACAPLFCILLFFAFLIDYCVYLWHNIDTAKCADYAILQMYVQICGVMGTVPVF